MATIASLVVQIGADVAGIRTGVDQANEKMDSFASKVMSVGKVIAASAVFTMVAQGIREVVSAATEIDELAGRIDDTASNVQKLQAVANDYDVELTSVIASIQEMQAKLGSGKLDQALERININVADFRALSPTDQFLAAADALGKIEDPALRAAMAKEVLGKGAKGVSNALREGVKDTEAWLTMSDKTVDSLDTLSRLWDKGKTSLTAFGAEFLVTVSGVRAYEAAMEAVIALQNKFNGTLPRVGAADVYSKAAGPMGPDPNDVKAFEEIEKALTKSAKASMEINQTKEKIRENSERITKAWQATVTYFNTADNLGTTFRSAVTDSAAAIANAVEHANDLATLSLPEAARAAADLRREMEAVGAVFANTVPMNPPGATGSSGGLSNMMRGVLGGSINLLSGLIPGQSHLGSGIGSAAGSIVGSIGSLAGSTLGSLLGPLGGLAGGLIGQLFGQSEHAKVNDMRDAFVSLSGGIGALDAKAAAAGVTLDRLLRAKTVQEYEAAVSALTNEFDDQAQLLERGLAAMERYGISIEQAGSKFKQTQMNVTAESLIEDFRALMNVGVDLETVIDKMGPAVGRYVHQSIEMGTTVPREMQGIIAKMIEAGTLTDMNGDKFDDLSQIPFADSLNAGLTKLIDRLDLLLQKIGVDLPRAINNVPSLPDLDPNGLLENSGGVPPSASGAMAPATAVHIAIDARGALVGDYASQQRLADVVSEALVGRAELRGRFSFAGAGF